MFIHVRVPDIVDQREYLINYNLTNLKIKGNTKFMLHCILALIFFKMYCVCVYIYIRNLALKIHVYINNRTRSPLFRTLSNSWFITFL